ncbi:MBL fold metallo-hydrolase [Armatimonas sp.]|uniref:MBL fold metallo-hydrolase n=1 Tax=Armatimonas sp. TaxID=1872638 RepID=UPI003753A3AB
MILRQFLDTEPTVAASYLLGCGGQGICAVVNPTEDIQRFQDAADSLGMRITYVVDTHAHADHLSGGRQLAEAVGAAYVLHELALGNVILQVLHTPGHTPEHISLLVTDKRRADEPWFVLTGHTLMVGDMGRTELASSPEEGARDLFHSAQRLKTLPDHIEVLPGAFAGSVCGRALSGKPTSTIGFERRHNKAFAIEDEEEFVRFMLAYIPPRPPQAEEIRRKNLGR